MVYRVYVEKKSGFDNEAKNLLREITELLELKEVTNVRVINRYDVENIEKNLFDYCVKTVFSEHILGTFDLENIVWNYVEETTE